MDKTGEIVPFKNDSIWGMKVAWFENHIEAQSCKASQEKIGKVEMYGMGCKPLKEKICEEMQDMQDIPLRISCIMNGRKFHGSQKSLQNMPVKVDN